MKTYLINLDRSTDRLNLFAAQAARYGIEFERISAVDGGQLSDAQRSAVVAGDYEFQPINAAEIGLFLSHKQAWQRLLDSGEPHAAVFEDDAVLAETISATFAAIDRANVDFDVIKLETTLRQVVCTRTAYPLSSGQQLQRLLSWHGGTAGYVVAAGAAQRLLQLKQSVADTVDQVMFHPLSKVSAQLRILQIHPAICIQKDILDRDGAAELGSTINRNETRGVLFRHGPLIDFRRMVKRLRARQLREKLARRADNVQQVIPFAQAVSVRCAS